jgi:hypothetical protein
MRNACKVLLGKPDGERPHENPRRQLDGNIEMVLKEIRW